jgi:hypothetical protein
MYKQVNFNPWSMQEILNTCRNCIFLKHHQNQGVSMQTPATIVVYLDGVLQNDRGTPEKADSIGQ